MGLERGRSQIAQATPGLVMEMGFILRTTQSLWCVLNRESVISFTFWGAHSEWFVKNGFREANGGDTS